LACKHKCAYKILLLPLLHVGGRQYKRQMDSETRTHSRAHAQTYSETPRPAHKYAHNTHIHAIRTKNNCACTPERPSGPLHLQAVQLNHDFCEVVV
jgi:hypothetical protein